VILFPAIAALIAFAVLSAIALLAGDVIRERSWHPQHRPVLGAVFVVALIALVLVIFWIVSVGQQ
jgi:membrane protein DedA with SNARE-associated domain